MGKTTLLYLSISDAFIPRSLSGGGPGGGGGAGVAIPRNRNVSALQSGSCGRKVLLERYSTVFYWIDKLYKFVRYPPGLPSPTPAAGTRVEGPAVLTTLSRRIEISVS